MPFKSRRKADKTYSPSRPTNKRKKTTTRKKKPYKPKFQKRNKLDVEDKRLAAEGLYCSPNFKYFDANGKPINW